MLNYFQYLNILTIRKTIIKKTIIISQNNTILSIVCSFIFPTVLIFENYCGKTTFITNEQIASFFTIYDFSLFVHCSTNFGCYIQSAFIASFTSHDFTSVSTTVFSYIASVSFYPLVFYLYLFSSYAFFLAFIHTLQNHLESDNRPYIRD